MLTLSQLKTGYDGKTIVDMPAFSLPSGEHCLILGASGSGKTTLLYTIAGLLSAQSGDIIIENTHLASLSTTARDSFRGQHIGIVFQTLHMVAALSVIDNILLAAYAAGLSQSTAKADRLLSLLGIQELRLRKSSTLSHGQQQRVAIARAAINSPKLLLCDEPTSALDDASCRAVMDMLLAIARECGASLVVATHDARIKPHFAHTLQLEAAHA